MATVTTAGGICLNPCSRTKVAKRKEKLMDTQRRLERIRTASSLVGLALEFALLGILILAKGDSEGVSMAGGLIGIFLGATFLIWHLLSDVPFQSSRRRIEHLQPWSALLQGKGWSLRLHLVKSGRPQKHCGVGPDFR